MAAVNPGQGGQQATSNSPSRPTQSTVGNGNTGGNQGNGNAGNGNQNGNGAQTGNNGGLNTTPNTPSYTPPAAATTSTYTPPAATTQAQIGNPGTSSNGPANNNPFVMSSVSSSRASSSAISSSSSVPSSSSSSSSRSSSSSSSSSSSANSSSTSSTASSSATAFANDAPASSTKTMKGSTIGAIVGGVVGGLILLVLLWMFWRRRKERKNRVPPPPPRDMAYTSQSIARHRASMSTVRPGLDGGGASVNRASSYSTLLNARPSSMSHSRHPSSSGYYSSYPIATPSSGSHEPIASPFMPASAGPAYPTDTSPPLNADETAPVAGPASTDGNAPAKFHENLNDAISPLRRPNLIPLDTGGYREGSSSSVSGSSSGRSSKPKHKNSIDRLRHESSLPNIAGVGAGGPVTTATNSRAASPSLPSEGEPSSRATSPNPSTYAPSHAHSSSYGYGIQPRQYISSSLSPHPRPYSTMSMNTMGPVSISGAPHQGRRMMLQMPELLSPTSPRADSMSEFGDEWRGRRSLDMLQQGQVTRDHRMSTMSDFGPVSPTSTIGRHQRLPSSQSTQYSSARSHQAYDQTEEVV